MANWASLSKDIVFEALHSPTDMQHKEGIASFAVHPLLQGKPRTQHLGTELQEITITCRFHHMIKPFEKVRMALRQAAINATVLQWVWGTGEVLGDFLIYDWKEKPRKTDEIGAVLCTEIEISLREYAGPGIAAQTGIDAKKAAFANKDLKIIQAPPTLAPSPLETLDKNMQITTLETKKIVTQRDKWVKGLTTLKKMKEEMQKASNKITTAVNAINTAINIGRNIKNATSISAATGNVAIAIGALNTALGGNTPGAQVSTLVNDVSGSVGVLENDTQSALVVKSWFATLGGN